MGDRAENLRRALERLAAHMMVRMRSTVYETAPLGVGAQPHFLNMVVGGETELGPRELLLAAKGIESELGAHAHNEPRTIDIDILLFGDLVLDSEDLVIPHPRMHERAFVMRPLDEIAPLRAHPKLRRPIADLWDELAGERQDIVEYGTL